LYDFSIYENEGRIKRDGNIKCLGIESCPSILVPAIDRWNEEKVGEHLESPTFFNACENI